MATRVGIIGLSASDDAWVSRTHGMALKKAPLSSKYQLTAVATTSSESAAASAARWGISPENAYTNAEDIAADPNVDMVVVGVKLPLHYELVLPALKAGKDVFVEWPLATDMNQVRELQAAAKRGGGRATVGLQARGSPSILKAKEIIDSGALGKIVATTVVGWDNMLLYLPPRYDYEHEAKNRADISTITSGHVLDALCFLLGEFDSLSSVTNCFFPNITTPHHKGPVTRNAPDSLLVQGTLKSGTVVSFSMVLTPADTPSSLTWTIVGEKGALKFEGNNINIQIFPPNLYWYRSEPDSDSLPAWQEVPVEEPLAFGQVGELYQALADGEKVPGVLTDFDGAALRHSMLEACAKSSRDGTRESYI
ncbi:Galactose/lactose metabolism regulatory protein GAL80 [Talaromyces islandicus]|uniref:Galactose/lactose metabolism regulatory protein GAL80 n=1 Tax=Talaromyces islandicus TaxID=28573 RepID=A0A0U1LNQ9_TALIS|nr:Galactose/lactose metabolism regulatory protein GAL80 [Talaromyces islandicus]